MNKVTNDLKDSDLYKVNVDKSSLKTKREKLKRDRFREKERLSTSKTEKVLVKKFQEKV